MYEYKLAYRHWNNNIEGFKGTGFSRGSARRDCINQIKRKIVNIIQITNPSTVFDNNMVIESFEGLNKKEIKQIKEHWEVNFRY